MKTFKQPLFALLLAAVALVPIAANAQEGNGSPPGSWAIKLDYEHGQGRFEAVRLQRVTDFFGVAEVKLFGGLSFAERSTSFTGGVAILRDIPFSKADPRWCLTGGVYTGVTGQTFTSPRLYVGLSFKG